MCLYDGDAFVPHVTGTPARAHSVFASMSRPRKLSAPNLPSLAASECTVCHSPHSDASPRDACPRLSAPPCLLCFDPTHAAADCAPPCALCGMPHSTALCGVRGCPFCTNTFPAHVFWQCTQTSETLRRGLFDTLRRQSPCVVCRQESHFADACPYRCQFCGVNSAFHKAHQCKARAYRLRVFFSSCLSYVGCACEPCTLENE